MVLYLKALMPVAQPLKNKKPTCLTYLIVSAIFREIISLANPPPPKNNASTFDNDNEKNEVTGGNAVLVADSTTRMVNDTEVLEASRFNQKRLPVGLLNSMSLGYVQEIKQFLQKPVTAAKGVFQTTHTVGQHLEVIDLPTDLFAKNIYKDKIKGYLAINGTVVLRLQVNAQPFMAGRLMLHYVPCGQLDPIATAYRVDGLMRSTQTPNVQVDLGSSHEAVIRIPYIAPTLYYNISNGQLPWGRAYLTVYSPLLMGVTGFSDCYYHIWASFEDIDITVPTIEPQADNSSRRKGNLRRQNRFKQMADAEESDAATKPISYGLSQAAGVADVLGNIPLISSFAKPASWVLDAAAGVASAFGYSKPQHTLPATKIVSRTIPYAQNCDGPDTSETMGVSAENKVELLAFAGTDRDEMTISHFCSISGFYGRVLWDSAQVQGHLLESDHLEPFRYRSTQIIATNYTYAAMLPMSLCATMFEFWRGSIRLTIKAVKTRFHTGRLVLAYVPWGKNVSPTVAFDDTDFVMREVLDMETANEWTFTFPWVSTRQWHRNGPSTHLAHETPYDPYGYWFLFVETPLRTTSACYDGVWLLFEFAGGEDLEFAVPKQNQVCPVKHTEEPLVIEAQVDDQDRPEKINDAIASSRVIPSSVDPARFTVGERITSINQLLKKQCLLPIFMPGAAANSLIIQPMCVGAYSYDGAAVTTVRMAGDYFSVFGSCYAFSRGSVRIRAYLPTTNQFRVRLIYPSSPLAPATNGTPVPWMGGSDSIFSSGMQGVVDVHIPMYSYFHANFNFLNNNQAYFDWMSTAYLEIARPSGTFDFTTSPFYRSVGDDFQLGFFIGVPPMIIAIT